MTDRLVPDPVPYSAVGRLCVAFIFLIVIAAGLPGGTDRAASYGSEDRQVSRGTELSAALDSLTENLDDVGSEELAMGWADLCNDLESVIEDLENGRLSVDVDGLVRRVESFRESFESERGMNELRDDWDQLARILNDLENDADR